MSEIKKMVRQVGNRILTVTTRNGINHGAMTVTHSGKKELECCFENGVLSGKFVRYYTSGHVMSVLNYFKGKKQGSFVLFYESGVKQLTGSYKDDEYHGIIKTYDEFGDLIKIETYVNGMLHGRSVSFYPKSMLTDKSSNGIMEVAFYSNGLLHGSKISFTPDGQISSLVPYSQGRPLRYSAR